MVDHISVNPKDSDLILSVTRRQAVPVRPHVPAPGGRAGEPSPARSAFRESLGDARALVRGRGAHRLPWRIPGPAAVRRSGEP